MLNQTNKQITEVIAKAEDCIATLTSNVVKKYRYDAECGGGCITSLHALVIQVEALKRIPTNCLDASQVTKVYETIKEFCKDNCTGESVQTTTVPTDSYVVLGTEDNNFIVQETNDYILI